MGGALTLIRKTTESFPQYIAKITLNTGRNVRLIHRVNVNVGDTVGVQIDDLIGGVGNACLLHSGGIGAELIHKALEALRHKGA